MRETSFDLIGIGAALLDLSVNIDDAFLSTHKISKGHMALTKSDVLKKLCEDLPIAKIASGGATANTLVVACGLGASAGFIGLLGADDEGEKYIADLEHARVRWLGALDKTLPSGACLSLVTKDAQRSLLTSLAASAALDESHLPKADLARTKILLLEGYLWDSPSAKRAALKVADQTRAQGGLIALNLSDGLCVERHFDEFQNFPTDILIGNEVEAKRFYQTDDLAQIEEKIKATAYAFAAITRGNKGALVFEKDQSYPIAAAPIEKLVDSTGAGDAFAGGFLFGVVSGKGAKISGALGAEAAAKIVQHFGARS